MRLAHLPTPLEHADRLTAAWGGPHVWFKRDDLTGYGLSGNKVRKLERHFAAAAESGADTVITCGAVQSNHCRATALAAARLGLRCVLLLRSADGNPPAEVEGNYLLQRLAGADVRFITPDDYQRRDELMAEVVDELGAVGRTVRIIPEGGSDDLGREAFADAITELAEQVDADSRIDDGRISVWHASSSAGTTAGMAAGVARLGRPWRVMGSSVGDPAPHLTGRVNELLPEGGAFEIRDDHIGLGYGKTTDAELAVQLEATQLTGLLWDPTYTGKAIVALKAAIDAGEFDAEDHVVFWHTGGGFALFSHDWSGVL